MAFGCPLRRERSKPAEDRLAVLRASFGQLPTSIEDAPESFTPRLGLAVDLRQDVVRVALLQLANRCFELLGRRAKRRDRLLGVAAKSRLVLHLTCSRRPRIPRDPRGVEQLAEPTERCADRLRGLVP